MKQTLLARSLLSLSLLASIGASAASAQVYGQFPKDELPMIQRSVLPGTAGKMGEIGYDNVTGCRYFAAPRSGQLEVMDPPGMSTMQSLKDLPEPQGICVVSDLRKLILTCGDGSLKIFKIEAAAPGAAPAAPAAPGAIPAPAKADAAGRLTEEKSLRFPGECDPIRWDAKNKRAVFGHGKFISWVDPVTFAKSEKLEMPGAVKALAVEPGSSRLFVSIPSQGKIVLVDRDKWAITATWELKDATGNSALTLDEPGSRLFVACRTPAKLLMLDAKDGKELQRFNIGDDAQDCWWDPVGQRVYVSAGGGNGVISIIWNKAGTFVNEHQIDTAPGSRTSLFVPERRQYLVCAPSLGGNPTFVYIYVLPNAQEHHEPQPKHN